MELWLANDSNRTQIDPRITVNNDNHFPFLDMQLTWNNKGDLEFGVHLKPNQELKYLNRGSSHTPGCFKAITTGVTVTKRLVKLTSITDENRDKPLDEIYPHHFKALRKADLITEKIPTIGETINQLVEEAANPISIQKKKKQERDRKRAICFKIGFSKYWRKPVHVTLKEIRDRFPSLTWLRISMSYHRFPNLRDIFQGDLTSKLIENIGSSDFLTLPCNCRNKSACAYMGKCRASIVVYQATCLQTGKRYIGNTQQHVKKRMQQHIQDVKNLVVRGKKSDSFAEHFATLIPAKTERKEMSKHVKLRIDILWKGNPLSCVKTFGTRGCRLCAKERIEILKLVRLEPKKAINKNNEIYGACRHKPRFHKFCRLTETAHAITDESTMDERVNQPNSTTSTATTSSAFSFDTDISTDQREQDISGPPPMANDWASYIDRKKWGALARSRILEERDELSETVILTNDENEDLALGKVWVEELERARD